MRRSFLSLMTVLLMSGCASTGSNYYSYEGRGDYYYGSPTADVVIDSSGYGYGYSGAEFGYGYGFGYGGYGYGNPYSYYGYGYQSGWWIPSHPHYDPNEFRDSRAEHERLSRSALVRRETIQAPESAKWYRQQQAARTSSMSPYARPDSSANRVPSWQQRAPVSRRSAPIRSSSTIQSAPSPVRSAPPPAPMRSPPPMQRSSSRRQ